MKDKENLKYVKMGITAVVTFLICMCCFFVLLRIDGVTAAFQKVMSILMPFVYGAVLAYLLLPVKKSLEAFFLKKLGEKRKKTAASLAIGCALLLALLIITFVIVLVVPQIVTSVMALVANLPAQMESANLKLDDLLENQPQLQTWWEEFYTQFSDKLESWLTNDFLPGAQTYLTRAASQVVGVLTAVKNLLIGVIIALYLLATHRQFGAQANLLLRSIFPEKWAVLISKEVKYADKMFNGFFMGKILDSAIIGVICFVGCLIMGFGSPILIAVIVGITNIIPFFGPFIGAIPCALLLLLESPMHCLMFLIFILVLQQVDGNIIGPKILGDSTGLSSFWVMFAILLFGGLWGVVGMLVGVPLFAVIYDIIRQLMQKGIQKRGCEQMLVEYNETYHAPAEDLPSAWGKKKSPK